MCAIRTCMSWHYTISWLNYMTRCNFILHGSTRRCASTVWRVDDSYWSMIVVLLVWYTLSTCEMIWIVFALSWGIEVLRHVLRSRAHWPGVSVICWNHRSSLLASRGTLYRVIWVWSSVKGSSWVPILNRGFKPNLWNLTILNKCKLLFDSLELGIPLGISLDKNKEFLCTLPDFLLFI